MPLPATVQEARYLEPYLALPAQTEASQLFALPPQEPATRMFTQSNGRYGGRNQYAELQRAEQYRMELEARQQAMLLREKFAVIDPTQPDYPQQRMQALQQFPLAVADPVGDTIVKSGDFLFEKSTRRNPNQSIMERAALQGVRPEEILAFTDQNGEVDTVGLAALAGERQRALKPTVNPIDKEIRALSTEFKNLESASLDRTPQGKALKAKLAAAVATKYGIDPTVAPATTAAPATAPATAPAATPDTSELPFISTAEEAAALPSGTRFMTKKGMRIKP